VFICTEQSAFIIGLFLQCRPINYYWDKSVEGTCFNQQAFYYADAGFNLATDIIILSLPWVLFRSTRDPAPLAEHGPLKLTCLQNSVCPEDRSTSSWPSARSVSSP